MPNSKTELKIGSIYTDRMTYVNMKYPADWEKTVKLDEETYCGYGHPFYYRLSFFCPDKNAGLYCESPWHYLDSRKERKNNSDIHTDDYGNLIRRYCGTEAFTDRTMKYMFGQYDDFKLVSRRHVNVNGYDSLQAYAQKRYADYSDYYRKNYPNRQLLSYYYDQLLSIYSYSSQGKKYKAFYYVALYGPEYREYFELPDYGVMDFFIRDMWKQLYTDVHKRADGRYVACDDQKISWTASGIFYGYATEDIFDEMLDEVFLPCAYHGFSASDDLKKEIERQNQIRQKEFDQARAEKRRVQQIVDEQNREAVARRQQTYDYVRKTQQEIHNMQMDSYNKRNKSQAKLSEMRSDSILGNTRYTDRYGKEYVLHDAYHHAYKQGSTILTSDSHLDSSDIGAGWEELEKKKY